MQEIAFTKLDDHPPGTLVRLAVASFAEYFTRDPSRQEAWRTTWRNCDREIFERPEVAASGFVSCLNGLPVGMASWFPIEVRKIVAIGLNCVLPDFRGKGYGKRQILEVLRILRERGVQTVRVTTGEHSFFKPARRMYESCGFTESERGEKPDDPGFQIVKYELKLNGASPNKVLEATS